MATPQDETSNSLSQGANSMMASGNLFDLSGRTAVVTGGAGALGSAICPGLAAAGAAIAVLDLHLPKAEQVAFSVRESGARAVAFGGDLSRPDDVKRVFAEIDGEFGRIDILVNAISAPVLRHAPEDFPFEAWQTMIDSNLTSFFLCSQAAAQVMIREGRGGSIINFGSIASVSALGRGSLAYSAAKGGVLQVTRETAYAWADRNIRVNSILPCQFVNEGWSMALEDPDRANVVKRVHEGIPLGRMGQPAEIVGPVVFLASDASAMVTGVVLPVDGGNLAMNAGASLEW
jgi:NAD(P)-dependent dehydrogenase (short-subunit alcohol dehydrogenase family)